MAFEQVLPTLAEMHLRLSQLELPAMPSTAFEDMFAAVPDPRVLRHYAALEETANNHEVVPWIKTFIHDGHDFALTNVAPYCGFVLIDGHRRHPVQGRGYHGPLRTWVRVGAHIHFGGVVNHTVLDQFGTPYMELLSGPAGDDEAVPWADEEDPILELYRQHYKHQLVKRAFWDWRLAATPDMSEETLRFLDAELPSGSEAEAEAVPDQQPAEQGPPPDQQPPLVVHTVQQALDVGFTMQDIAAMTRGTVEKRRQLAAAGEPDYNAVYGLLSEGRLCRLLSLERKPPAEEQACRRLRPPSRRASPTRRTLTRRTP